MPVKYRDGWSGPAAQTAEWMSQPGERTVSHRLRDGVLTERNGEFINVYQAAAPVVAVPPLTGLYSIPANEIAFKGWGKPFKDPATGVAINPPLGTQVPSGASPTTGGVVAKVKDGVIKSLKRGISTDVSSLFDENSRLQYLNFDVLTGEPHYSAQIHRRFEWVGADGAILVCDTVPDIDTGFTLGGSIYFRGKKVAGAPEGTASAVMTACRFGADSSKVLWCCTFDVTHAILKFWKRQWGAPITDAWTFIASFDCTTLDSQFNVVTAVKSDTHGMTFRTWIPPCVMHAISNASGTQCLVKIGYWGAFHHRLRDATRPLPHYWHGHLLVDTATGGVSVFQQTVGSSTTNVISATTPTSTTLDQTASFIGGYSGFPMIVDVGWDGDTQVNAVIDASGTINTFQHDLFTFSLTDSTSSELFEWTISDNRKITLTLGGLTYDILNSAENGNWTGTRTTNSAGTGGTMDGIGTYGRDVKNHLIRLIDAQNQVVVIQGGHVAETVQKLLAFPWSAGTAAEQGTSTVTLNEFTYRLWARDQWVDLKTTNPAGTPRIAFRPGFATSTGGTTVTTQGPFAGQFPSYPQPDTLWASSDDWNYMNYRYFNGLFVLCVPQVLKPDVLQHISFPGSSDDPTVFTMVTRQRANSNLSSTDWTIFTNPPVDIAATFGVTGTHRLKNLRLI